MSDDKHVVTASAAATASGAAAAAVAESRPLFVARPFTSRDVDVPADQVQTIKISGSPVHVKLDLVPLSTKGATTSGDATVKQVDQDDFYLELGTVQHCCKWNTMIGLTQAFVALQYSTEQQPTVWTEIVLCVLLPKPCLPMLSRKDFCLVSIQACLNTPDLTVSAIKTLKHTRTAATTPLVKLHVQVEASLTPLDGDSTLYDRLPILDQKIQRECRVLIPKTLSKIMTLKPILLVLEAMYEQLDLNEHTEDQNENDN